MSPSIHPLPAAPRPPGAALPSGLGAGGRGKDKAPCKYLHFEVDYDGPEEDGHMEEETRPTIAFSPSRPKRKIPLEARLLIGLGPDGKLTEPVSLPSFTRLNHKNLSNIPPVSTTVDKLRSARF
jgi:mRNA (2'-O-methyladenosine-N6-)-methyltransferase